MNRSIPEHSIERLFVRMEHIYGARFHDMWRSTDDFKAMKEVWREGLAGLNDEALKHGISALFHEKSPPTLPRFIELCQRDPMYVAPVLPAITHEHRVTPAGEAQLAKIYAMLKPLAQRSEVQGDMTGIEWAFKIVREANDHDVPLNKLTIAQDAIRNWCESHHCTRDALDEHGKWRAGSRAASYAQHEEIELPAVVPSPHIYGEAEAMREPGEDDE